MAASLDIGCFHLRLSVISRSRRSAPSASRIVMKRESSSGSWALNVRKWLIVRCPRAKKIELVLPGVDKNGHVSALRCHMKVVASGNEKVPAGS
jgi:hypothetical protein